MLTFSFFEGSWVVAPEEERVIVPPLKWHMFFHNTCAADAVYGYRNVYIDLESLGPISAKNLSKM